MKVTRKEFLKAGLAVAGVGVGLSMGLGCSDDNGGGKDSGTNKDSSTSKDSTATDTTQTQDTVNTSDATNQNDTVAEDMASVDSVTISSCETTGITNNHGHVLTVSVADTNLTSSKTYDISGSSPHSHSVTLTAQDFQQLKQGKPITVASTSAAGHTHDVTVQCA